jgi:hypothetical protein
MTQVSLSPKDLGQLLTLITNFMCCDPSPSYKTYDELLAIYHSCKDLWPQDHESNDLRITDFINDMKDAKWRDPDIVIGLGIWQDRVLVRDGIHRGVAYLDCFNDGMPQQELPPLYLGY